MFSRTVFSKNLIRLNLEIQLTIKISEKTERRFGVILASLSSKEKIIYTENKGVKWNKLNEHRTVTFSLNLIYSISHLYFLYKLSFPLHSLLDNDAKMTPKRRSVFSLIFTVKSFL